MPFCAFELGAAPRSRGFVSGLSATISSSQFLPSPQALESFGVLGPVPFESRCFAAPFLPQALEFRLAFDGELPGSEGGVVVLQKTLGYAS